MGDIIKIVAPNCEDGYAKVILIADEGFTLQAIMDQSNNDTVTFVLASEKEVADAVAKRMKD